MVMVAIVLIVLLGISAFAVDLGYDRQLTRHQQGATDAASLGGANFLPANSAAPGQLQQARDEAARLISIGLSKTSAFTYTPTCTGTSPNLTCTYTMGPNTVTVETPVTSVTFAGIPSYNLIRVRVCRDAPVFFGHLLGSDERTVCRESIARRRNIFEGFSRGLIALDPDDCEALTFSGSSDTNLYSDGAVIVESNCQPNALDGGGSAWEVQAGLISVVGGYVINPCTVSSCLNGTTPVTGSAPQGDPLSDVPEPSAPALAPAVTPGGTNPISGGSACTNTYHPGRYTSELFINNNQVACFEAGLYYFEDGIRTNGNAEIYGDSVLFFVKGGDVDMNGTGRLVLNPVPNTAPTTHPLYAYRGISIFQSRTNTSPAKINGNDASSIGTIYMPAAHLDFQGSASSVTEDFVTGAVIANTIRVTGSGYLSINAEEPVQGDPAEPELGLQR